MKRPWNSVNTAIYSLVTGVNDQFNMNICSYVSAVSRKPKLYVVAIDPETFTYQLLKHSNKAVLQLLHSSQQTLVRTLGKKSGRTYDKMKFLEKKGALIDWQEMPVLRNSCAWMSIEKLDECTTGDHQLFTFKVNKYKSRIDREVLTWDELVEAKIIL